ncbi:MAG: hypothetical protein IPI67_30440 [Myxococcales bacterium]|nr:hypothetical protein [Myxococcales bacterium]
MKIASKATGAATTADTISVTRRGTMIQRSLGTYAQGSAPTLVCQHGPIVPALAGGGRAALAGR